MGPLERAPRVETVIKARWQIGNNCDADSFIYLFNSPCVVHQLYIRCPTDHLFLGQDFISVETSLHAFK